jgi:hypothetical protein
MIFHEIYSVYYQAVAKILERVQQGQVSREELGQIVSQTAFAESSMTILPALQKGQWQLLTPDGKTPIVHRPTMPLTLLQKQWLKALTLDPRFRLFDIELPDLEDIAPLFTPSDFVVYDRYGDGDPYEDEDYIARFRLILRAIGEKRPLRLQIRNRKGSLVWVRGYGQRLEYSQKDDKFRLLLTDRRNDSMINLARITDCSLLPVGALPAHRMNKKQALELTLQIRNERNTLERCLLHFAHFKKRVERIDRLHYTLYLSYDREDETEVLIRILSFGPFVEVLGPATLREQIIARLKTQKSCGL